MATYPIAKQFERFCGNLAISCDTLAVISYRYHSITKRLNADFWDSSSDEAHGRYVGSYGRGTRIDGSDVDILFRFPYNMYVKYDAYASNGQSALLQAAKMSIATTYPSTRLKGDGQIVAVDFSDGINFEVLPAFECEDGSYLFPDSNGGGRWRACDPVAEINELNSMDEACNGNLKRLCKMARAWREANSVSISGIAIDVFAYNFMKHYSHRDDGYIFYDRLTRDFFAYVANLDATQSTWKVFGSGRYVTTSGYFRNKAAAARNKAIEAIKDQDNGYMHATNDAWKEIYGSRFPRL
ncbi:Uncharacterised protein [Slackia heliotrinireducens]|uniref:Nucleotidyltransferase n=1 Tax=Slackia heliotrinireducens (strain ATCC 29202 / DSM 20476 / NCTC 11029 / RHS 1) TaxID=471855 RepID=C7N252_SLAHD|nr:nucleotidyltransferase [Slackia heliotrinireducens]ACV21358.1 hypothetical protein Shel_02900 [Slackia heliotrinireducens DSM 20476]VEG98791.1 Uncharacterised protein [Slackia heliotrinireducens]